MDLNVLKTVLLTHPSYATATDEELWAWVNEKVMSRDRETVPAPTILACILSNVAEWTPISDANKQLVRDILYVHSAEGVPTKVGSPARTALVAILGNATKSAIAGAINEVVSRAAHAGLVGDVSVGDIYYARRL